MLSISKSHPLSIKCCFTQTLLLTGSIPSFGYQKKILQWLVIWITLNISLASRWVDLDYDYMITTYLFEKKKFSHSLGYLIPLKTSNRFIKMFTNAIKLICYNRLLIFLPEVGYIHLSCCITNYHKLNSLKHTFMISQLPWLRSLSIV